MKTIKKNFEPNDENDLETSSPLTGAIIAVVIGIVTVLAIICLVAASVYFAEWVVKFL